MGDRANVYIHDGDSPGIYLYTHWTGTELPSIVKKTMETDRAKARADDEAYLARIVFEDLICGDLGSETGYGISAQVGDGSDRIVDIDTKMPYGQAPNVSLIGYPYTWENIPADPFNICEECGQQLPD